MELRQFTYVNTVAECGSFTKAAEKLFISQPALSNYVARVEEDLGVKLFDRSTNPMILTYAGEQYIKRARAILIQLEDMNREIRDITHHISGRLRLGFPNERVVYMLPLLLPALQKRYPGITVEVVNDPGNSLTNSLRKGDVDFVFLPSWRSRKGIAQRKICEEEIVLVTAKGYLRPDELLDPEARVVDWQKVMHRPLLTLKRGHAMREFVDLLYRRTGGEENIFLETHSNMLSYRLAAQGLGMAIIPQITLNMMAGSMESEYFHLAPRPLTWEVQALYREDSYIGEVESALLDLATQVMTEHNNML